MNGPRDYLNKARAMRKPPAAPQPAPVPLTPAPVAPAPTMLTPTPEPAPNARTRRVVPQPVGGHAIYRELMRSHDRMGTRHLDRG